MADWKLPADVSHWIGCLAGLLHARSAWRLQPLLLGVLFAQGRRTVTSWLRAAGLQLNFRQYYYFLSSLGRNTRHLAARLLGLVIQRIAPGKRLLFALDDSPTKRFGPCVEGAGIHHNPTPGPADQQFVYGHIWVTLALIAHHPLWGTLALPLWACLYVRAKDVVKLPRGYRWKFRTKLEMAAEMVEWAVRYVKHLGKTVWIVVDGAYAKRPFLQRVLKAGVVVVSRLRKDAALHDLPLQNPPGKQRGRGRPRKYGKKRIHLAKRAGQRCGWSTEEFQLYGQLLTKTYKTFLATYAPVGGLIRVVLVKETDGWVAFFCSDPNASVAEILEAMADRGAIEQTFHDIKEVHGAGQQQVRNLWANLGAFHVNLWMYTLIEVWAWTRTHGQLCDRSASPWDDPTRRPSHADRRKALRREVLREHFSALRLRRPMSRKIRQYVRQVLALAV